MEILKEALTATAAVLANTVIAALIGFVLYKLGLFADLKR